MAASRHASDFVSLAETILKALDLSGIGMSITAHRDGKLERLYANRAGAAILGYSEDELAQLPPLLPVVEDERPKLEELHARWLAGEPIPELIETEVLTPDGRRVPVEVGLAWADYEGAPATVAFLRDLSERRQGEVDRRRIEAELLQADRMATVGTLAAGVAHEINNPLAYLLLNLERIDRALRERGIWDEELGAMLGTAREGGERVHSIVRDLLTYSGPDVAQVGPVRVDEAIRVALSLAEKAFRHEVAVETQIEEDVPPVSASSARLGQVVTNLLVNAAQAFGHATERPKVVRVTLTKAPGGGAQIEVADNGVGIAEGDLPRVFEPFFTTKPAGVGTGLGLAITRSIVTSLGGEITVESKRGEGTRVTVTLPAARDGQQAPPDSREPPPETARATLLLVDDERDLVEALADVLRQEHDVIAHIDAREALSWLLEGGRPDLVICDLVMPKLSGIELYRLAADHDESLADRFVFITGGASTPSAAEFVKTTNRPVLSKPLDMHRLRSIIGRR